MNKIVVEQESLNLNNQEVILKDIKVNNLHLNIQGEVTCGISNISDNLNITINIEKNSTLNIDFLVHLKDIKNKIIINSKENSKLFFNYACTYENTNELYIYNYIKENNTKTSIHVRTVENNGSLNVLAEGEIFENTLNSEYLEDIRALTTNNKSIKIMPNLLVKTNQVIANHNATISNVSESNLFYLMSKGISRNVAIKLIKNGFLKGILKIEDLKMGGEETYE